VTLRIVNIVASGTLGRELDVYTVAEDIDAPVVKYFNTGTEWTTKFVGISNE